MSTLNDDNEYSLEIDADIYIDDRNYGGLPSWGEIYQNLCPDAKPIEKKKKGFWARIFG